MNVSPAILDERLWFPDPRGAPSSGDDNGLLAVGGELSVPRLLLAYRSGIFPWTDDPVTWWSPDPRAIFELDRFHVPRSLQRVLKRGTFTVTVDQAFRAVMEGCAEPALERYTTWISPAFVEAYVNLHRAGHAHSVECWREGRLVGGLYGVALGGFFAGESMFHREDNASKVALAFLIERLRRRGFALCDTQMLTPITRRLGGVLLPRDVYLARLAQAVTLSCTF
jgi:leucyl/phenylalanyl-tRNA--protein transferase